MKGNSVAEQKQKKKALLVIDVQENLLNATFAVAHGSDRSIFFYKKFK